MKTLKFKAIDQDIKQRIEVEDYNIGDTWDEQIELFFQFLQAQGVYYYI